MMWFKRQPDKKEELLGVNGLKITKNHKISLSVIPSSGIVTQSILYIYNIEKEDVGEYICGINTNPVITQVKKSNKPAKASSSIAIANISPHNFLLYIYLQTSQSGSLEIKPEDHTTTEQNHKKATKTTLPPNNNLSNDQQDFTVTTIIIDNNQKSSSNSTEGIFCIDFPKLWKDSKQEAQKFFYSIWDKLHRYF